jgi:hypothetical protein
MGAVTRERFLEGEGKKRFGVTAGIPCDFGSAHAAAAADAGFRRSDSWQAERRGS